MTPQTVREVLDMLWARLAGSLVDLDTGEVARPLVADVSTLSDWSLSALRAARTITDLRRLAAEVARGFGLKLEEL